MKFKQFEDDRTSLGVEATMRAPAWCLRLIFGRKALEDLAERSKVAPKARLVKKMPVGLGEAETFYNE